MIFMTWCYTTGEQQHHMINCILVEMIWSLYFSHDRFGGWSEEEHANFVMIYDQYPYDMANRRMLIIDRLKRQISGKTRAQLVNISFYNFSISVMNTLWPLTHTFILTQVHIKYKLILCHSIWKSVQIKKIKWKKYFQWKYSFMGNNSVLEKNFSRLIGSFFFFRKKFAHHVSKFFPSWVNNSHTPPTFLWKRLQYQGSQCPFPKRVSL